MAYSILSVFIKNRRSGGNNIVFLCLLFFGICLYFSGFVLPIAMANEFCGSSGVWVQVLGSGGGDMTNGRGGGGYLVWINGKARVLVNAGPGSALRFSESRAEFKDLDAVVFTNLHPDSSWDLPVLLRRSYFGTRKRSLPVFAPEGNSRIAGVKDVFRHWIKINPTHTYPAEMLAVLPNPVPILRPFRMELVEVPAKGLKKWVGWRNSKLQLQALAVAYEPVPTLAWQIIKDDFKITFLGIASEHIAAIREFAEGSNLLVMNMGITKSLPSGLRSVYANPAAMGRIATRAKTDILLLGHRTWRTLGAEVSVRKQIKEQFKGTLLFADDNQCFGL